MAAAQHVESARAQRALIDSRIGDARADRALPLAQRKRKKVQLSGVELGDNCNMKVWFSSSSSIRQVDYV